MDFILGGWHVYNGVYLYPYVNDNCVMGIATMFRPNFRVNRLLKNLLTIIVNLN